MFPRSEAPGTTGPAGTPPAGKTILLVEDQDAVRKMALAYLRKLGYTVLQARDGEEALEVAAAYSQPINLLLTDIRMPRMGGLELAERLVRLRPQLLVLCMSGYSEQGLVPALGGQPVAFLQKPFVFKELARKLAEMLP